MHSQCMECSKLSWVSGLDGIKSVFSIKAVAYLVVGNIFKKKMRSTCQEEFLYADDLALVNESLEGFILKLRSVAKHLT